MPPGKGQPSTGGDGMGAARTLSMAVHNPAGAAASADAPLGPPVEAAMALG